MGGEKNLAHNTEKILQQGKDAFDLLEWDRDPSSVLSIDRSPKPAPMKSQPVTYTTVGSLVNPKSVQQFAAPNRIQREGANRRPLMSIIANRSFDSIFQTRGPPPPLNLSNSMQYAEQLSRNHLQVEPISSSVSETFQDSILSLPPRELSSLPMNTQNTLLVSDQERSSLKAQFNGKASISLIRDNSSNLPIKLDSREYNTGEILSYETVEEEMSELCPNLQTRAYGMEKMQKLQRLSKFKNPIQEWARNKLSGFSAINQPTTLNKPLAAEILSHAFFSLSGDKRSGGSKTVSKLNENNFSYHSSAVKMQQNPQLWSGTITHPLDYPQPLTAGPPGQRQSSSIFNQCNFYYPDTKVNNIKISSQEATLDDRMVTQSSNQVTFLQPQEERHGQLVRPWAGHSSSNLVDTLSREDAAQYYPQTWPTGATELKEKESMCLVFAEEKSASKNFENIDNWFYSGQRRFARITTQFAVVWNKSHDQDHAESYIEPNSSLGTASAKSGLKQVPTGKISRNSTSICAAPLVESLLDTLLEYSDKQTPGSRANLSHFVENPESCLDITENDESSLFDN